jgi:hypothetical protein
VLCGNRNLQLLFSEQIVSNPQVVDLVGARAGHLDGVAEAAANVDRIGRVGDARQVQVRTNSFRAAFRSAVSVPVWSFSTLMPQSGASGPNIGQQ